MAYPPRKICAEIALSFVQSSEKFPPPDLEPKLGKNEKKDNTKFVAISYSAFYFKPLIEGRDCR